MTFSLSFGKDDEFEDEPEDELASSGMHVVEDIPEADDDDEVKVKDDDLEEVALDVVEPVEEVDELKDEDSAPDGLAELAELERGLINEPLTFGDSEME